MACWFQGGKLFPLHTLAAARPLPLVSAYLLILVGTFLIFISILDIQIHIPQPLVYLGKISYGLYLFHLFSIWLIFDSSYIWPRMIYFHQHKPLGVLIALSLTIATAALSYHFFERPILKFKERFETIHTASRLAPPVQLHRPFQRMLPLARQPPLLQREVPLRRHVRIVNQHQPRVRP